jgi:hypothetical protein
MKMIGKLIQEMELEPVPLESLITEAPLASARGVEEKEKAAFRLFPRPFPGGIRIAHMHYRGDIYLLDEKQWADFSGRIIKDFQSKLSKVSAVSFEQAMELSDAVDSLARQVK